MSVETCAADKEKLRARAMELSKRIAESIDAAGITLEQLEKDTYETFLRVKKERRFSYDQ